MFTDVSEVRTAIMTALLMLGDELVTLMMAASSTSETSVNIYQTT
jgi:hypothetical protein